MYESKTLCQKLAFRTELLLDTMLTKTLRPLWLKKIRVNLCSSVAYLIFSADNLFTLASNFDLYNSWGPTGDIARAVFPLARELLFH